MYKRIVLAYDGTLEGRAALREGALLAKQTGAKVFLLSVVAESAGMLLAEGAHAGALSQEQTIYQSLLDGGEARLREIGLEPQAKLAVGEPVAVIGDYAREIGADLIVIGHRKQNVLQRWWRGSVGASLLDYTNCSVLISRNTLNEEQFAAALKAFDAPA